MQITVTGVRLMTLTSLGLSLARRGAYSRRLCSGDWQVARVGLVQGVIEGGSEDRVTVSCTTSAVNDKGYLLVVERMLCKRLVVMGWRWCAVLWQTKGWRPDNEDSQLIFSLSTITLMQRSTPCALPNRTPSWRWR